MRGIMTFFSPKTHEWEIYPSNIVVNGYDDYTHFIKYKLDAEASKLYITKSLAYANMPKDFSINDIDSCYEFDFHKNSWTNLGATNPELIKVLQASNYYNFNFNDLLIFQNYLDYYWINFKKNEFGKIKSSTNNLMKQPWLSLYSTKESYESLQFNLGSTVYLIKITAGKKLSYASYSFDATEIDQSTVQYVYQVENPLAHFSLIKLFLILPPAFLLLYS